jgi:hypothetical protein
VLIHLSLNRWGFLWPVRHLQIYHKYKVQGVPFPPDFRVMMHHPKMMYDIFTLRETPQIVGSRQCDRTIVTPLFGVSLGAWRYRTSRCITRHGGQKQGIPPVAGDTTLPSELPQENHDVLKKLREMNWVVTLTIRSLFPRLSVDLGKSHGIIWWFWSTGSTLCDLCKWEGLWDKGVFKKWNHLDLLKNDRVFTSRYVCKK